MCEVSSLLKRIPFSDTTPWQQGKTSDSSCTNLTISSRNLELSLRAASLCLAGAGMNKTGGSEEPHARNGECSAVREKEMISKRWGGRNREKASSWIPFLMSLSEFWDSLGGGGHWGFQLSPSFIKHLLPTPHEQLLGAEVPASLCGSFREPGPSPCHCAAWPRLSQLTTLPDLK